jgi:hypothetical protein
VEQEPATESLSTAATTNATIGINTLKGEDAFQEEEDDEVFRLMIKVSSEHFTIHHLIKHLHKSILTVDHRGATDLLVNRLHHYLEDMIE